ncbi:hypothetical protein Z043_121220, partial [Scleropages formosus]
GVHSSSAWKDARAADPRRSRRDQPPPSGSVLSRNGQESMGGGGAGGLIIDTLPDNMTRIVATSHTPQEDSQKYYSWQSFGPGHRRTEELWVTLGTEQHNLVRVHGILSNTHRQAARVALSFDFPFYGHSLRQITIATGGTVVQRHAEFPES